MSAPRSVELTWLGQAGFLLRFGPTSVAIDPFLAKHEVRLYEPPQEDVFVGGLDLLLATHEHGDHLDVELVPKLVNRFPELIVVVPAPLVSMVTKLAPDARVVGLQPGREYSAPDVTIRGVGAIHAVAMVDGYSDGRPSPDQDTRFLGYVLRSGELSIYHGGDTIVTEALLKELIEIKPNVAILPVNGRDYFREKSGIAGNLTAREAVELAAAIGSSVLIPMHHDLVRNNTERAGACADLAAELNVPLHVLNPARLRMLALPVSVR